MSQKSYKQNFLATNKSLKYLTTVYSSSKKARLFLQNGIYKIKQGYHYLNKNPFHTNGFSPSGKSEHCTWSRKKKLFDLFLSPQ